MIFRLGICLVLIFAALLMTDSVSASESIEQEYKIRRAFIEARERDFYVHKKKSDEFEKKRQDSGKQEKEKREHWIEEMEKARLSYISKRKQKSTEEEQRLEQQWLKEKEAREKAFDLIREKYVLRRNQLRQMEKSLKTIPEAEEFGITN